MGTKAWGNRDMGIGSLGCPHGTVSFYHLIRPNIGNVVHGVPSDRDLRIGNGVADCLSRVFMCSVF